MQEEDLNNQGLQAEHGVYLLARCVQPVELDFAVGAGKGAWSGGELSCGQAGSSGSCRDLLWAARLLCLLISGSCHPILACSASPAAVHEKLMPGPGPC